MLKDPQPQILVIDDEMSICIAVKDLLELYNYTVEYAITAEEGIDFLEENPQTDVVLLDINLGSGFNGIETLPIVKEKFKYLQVIMFTSMNTLETGLECMKKGALDYITKPYDDADLLKKIATALERKKIEQMNDLYLSIIVHDLKNPLQSVVGAMEFVKITLEETLSDQQKKFLTSAEKGINQIKVMINNILSISKFENGSLVARRQNFTLKNEVANSLELFEEDAEVQHKSLKTSFMTPDDYIINTDKDFFLQVLVNIVSNALRFTPREGTVSVNLENNGNDLVHVSVTNTGSYIDEKDRTCVFEKFSRVDLGSNLSKSGQNFGLGLTYCKMAVDALGGSIWVDGKQEVPETTFHFTIKNRKDA